MSKNYYDRLIEENFGQPLRIGDFAGQRLDGVRGTSYDQRDGAVCGGCGQLPIHGMCKCDEEDQMTCPSCREMPVGNSCSCGMMSEKKSMDSCSECGMRESMCQCGMKEEKKKSSKHFPNLSQKQAEALYAKVEKEKEAGKSLKDIFPWASESGPEAAYGALKARVGK
jgi:hypothetical protein